ncbi:hypothetical protein GOODEAATRI_021777 [Goodea atripinnis]|uniref:Uncharacterized protein n=1 Tax=Goodea atripinnis TaxID=208336 RepID=A0ABV0NM66_9TELE
MPQTAGSNGVCAGGHHTQPSTHAPVSTAGGVTQLEPHTPCSPQRPGFFHMCTCSEPVEAPQVSQHRRYHGNHPGDTSLTGWGGTHVGMMINGVWSSQTQTAHRNCLELLAVSSTGAEISHSEIPKRMLKENFGLRI